MSTAERIGSLPLWQGRPRWHPLKGGLSNESFTVEDDSGRYVVRFGRDFPFHHVFRARELAAARAAHAAGFAPEILHAEPGITVSRFIEGRTYDAEDVRANIERIAPLVRRFHAEMPARIGGTAFLFWVFHVIRDYARALAEGDSRMTARLPEFLALSAEMESAQIPMHIVFGHHDFLPANFIDDGRKIWIIDYEYAGFGTPMFDLAGIASNAGFDRNETEALLTAYLVQPPDQRFRRSHAAMQVASLLREAMWSMVSELHLNAPGVDYVAYTGETLAAFDAKLAEYRERFGGGADAA